MQQRSKNTAQDATVCRRVALDLFDLTSFVEKCSKSPSYSSKTCTEFSTVVSFYLSQFTYVCCDCIILLWQLVASLATLDRIFSHLEPLFGNTWSSLAFRIQTSHFWFCDCRCTRTERGLATKNWHRFICNLLLS